MSERLYQIEDNVPIPEISEGYGKRKSVIQQMREGQSIMVDSKKEANSFYVAARRLGVKMRRKKVDEGKFRIWRVN